MKLFFYGFFMDVDILAKKGITPKNVTAGWVDDFAVRISERATLVREVGGRVYGLAMDIATNDAEALYSADSVADYEPESLSVNTLDGKRIEAICYNLPAEKIVGENKEYAKKLFALAEKLDFPGSYTDQIKQAAQ